MKPSCSDLASALDHWRAAVEPLLRETEPAERPGRLADLLRELSPEASLAACLLPGAGPAPLAVRPSQGRHRPNPDALRDRLDGLDPLAAGVQSLPPSRGESGEHVLAAAISAGGRSRGFLVLGLPDATAEEVACVEVLLAACADTLGLRWRLAEESRERAELSGPALAGLAFAGLAHDLNNLLNSMVLQTSVVQLRVDEELRGELAAIRQHGAQAAGLIRELQASAHQHQPEAAPVDLNDVVRGVLAEEPEQWAGVRSDLAPDLPSVLGIRGNARQLVRLVLSGLLARRPAALTVRTEKHGEGVRLTVATEEAAGAEAEAEPPDADRVLWQNLDEVGRLAGRWLLQHLGGTLAVERRAGGGVVLHLDWGPPAS